MTALQNPADFIDRLKYLHEKFVNIPDWIEIVKPTVLKAPKEQNAELRQVCANGGEGLMLRKMDDAYQGGRTYDLRKFKPLEDTEAVVIGGHENGKQSLRVRDAEGREFHLTCGDQPPTGTIVTYQFTGKTKNGIPKHTSFLRIRGSL